MKKFYNSFKTKNMFLNILIIILWSPVFIILGIVDLIKLPIQLIKKRKTKEKTIKNKEKTKEKMFSEIKIKKNKLKTYKIAKITTLIIALILISLYIPSIQLMSLLFPLNIIISVIFVIITIPLLITYLIINDKEKEYKLEKTKNEIIEAIKDSN